MATYLSIHERANNGIIQAQISVALATEAKYILTSSQVADDLAWAAWVTPRTYQEAGNWSTVICADPAIADAVEVSDANVQAAVTALVPTMIQSYLSSQAPLA